MESEKRKVAVVGALNVDLGGLAAGPLARGDSVPGTVSSCLGGVGWNIARDCALLGARTAFFSLLGRDGHENAIRAEGARYGVDLAGCRWTEAPNNRYLYICDERGDVTAAVNDMRLCERMGPELARQCLPELNGFDAVAADANLPAETLAALGAGLTAPLAVDCVSAAKCGRLRAVLPRIHTLKANRLEAETLTGQTSPEACARALLRAGVKRAIISLGAEGILCGEKDGLFHMAAPHVPVADATGAGDALTAALAVGLAEGLSLADCAALGLAAAGVTLSQPGSVTEKLRTLAK